jgi:prepilin-type N-terminal cleavage/methylation domain-containing protein
MNLPKLRKGFTLIELLLVIAILSVLLVVVYASLNPTQRLLDTRNARRWNDVNQILTAIHECLVDNNGTLTSCGLATNSNVQLGTCTENANVGCSGATTAACEPLTEVTAGGYLASLPIDPDSTASSTLYGVAVANGIVTVRSCQAEGVAAGISVSR